MERRLAAILAADVAGYGRLMGADEAGTLAALKDHRRELVDNKIAERQGRIVKLTGDGMLVEFPSVVNAVTCAAEVQRGMADRNTNVPKEERIEFRIGVNLGDVIVEGDDIFGDGVNVAARLEGLAAPGGIAISGTVRDHIGSRLDLAFEDAGEKTLKNIDRPVRVYRVIFEPSTPQGRRVGTLTPRLFSQEKPSIAVLPFSNLSNDPQQEFFADGLVEDILTRLSKLSALTVIARNSSFAYKGRAIDVRQAGMELGVRYVLEGSVRTSGHRLRVTAQLIDTNSGAHVWADRYDRGVEDIFAVQDEITLILATEMQVNLTEGEHARLRYSTTTNVEAWNLWAQGLAHFRDGAHTRDGAGRARFYWEKALALDPNSPPLNAMLGFMHWLDALKGWWEDRETALRKATTLVERALSIDPTNADAHMVSAQILCLHERHDEAVAAIRRAMEDAPGSSDIAAHASVILGWADLHVEAIVQIQKAMRLTPNFPAFYFGLLGNSYRLGGRADDAIAAFLAFSERMPDEGRLDLAILYQQAGRFDEARAETTRHLASRPQETVHGWAATQPRKDKASVEADLAALRAAGLPE